MIPTQQIQSTHSSMIHDVQYDYYGDRLATCASDGYVHIYDVSKAVQNLIATIKVRDSPLWSISWAHPKFGSVLAVTSFEGEVAIYREQKEWIKVASYNHQHSVNCVSWFPEQLILGIGASDGSIVILDNEQNWNPIITWNAHDAAVHGIAFQGNKLASGSSDKSIKIWNIDLEVNHTHTHVLTLNVHTELVRDVKWHPLEPILASASEDGRVNIISNGQVIQTIDLHIPIWKISFNLVGNEIAVSTDGNGSQKIHLLRYNYEKSVYEVQESI